MPQEKLLVAKRQHWFSLIPPLFIVFCTAVFFSLIPLSLIIFLNSVIFSFISSLLIFLTITSLVLKILIDRHFHLYIVTNRKLLEIRYSPFGEDIRNEILLEQVKCTEVDMKKSGIIYQFLDIGDISITFDRPTHQHGFIIEHIDNCSKLSHFLSHILLNPDEIREPHPKPNTIWYRPDQESDKYQFTEEIFKKSLRSSLTGK